MLLTLKISTFAIFMLMFILNGILVVFYGLDVGQANTRPHDFYQFFIWGAIVAFVCYFAIDVVDIHLNKKAEADYQE